MIVGLTGSIGSGKSTVSRELARLGAVILDADAIAHEIVEPGQPALAQIAASFGAEYLCPDGSLNRKKLGELVFSSDEARFQLNAITHPQILAVLRQKLSAALAQDPSALVVIDAPLLFETGLDEEAEQIWVVYAREDVVLERLQQRDGFSAAEVQARLHSQMPVEEKLRRADRCIDNSGTLEELRQQLRALLQELGREI